MLWTRSNFQQLAETSLTDWFSCRRVSSIRDRGSQGAGEERSWAQDSTFLLSVYLSVVLLVLDPV